MGLSTVVFFAIWQFASWPKVLCGRCFNASYDTKQIWFLQSCKKQLIVTFLDEKQSDTEYGGKESLRYTETHNLETHNRWPTMVSNPLLSYLRSNYITFEGEIGLLLCSDPSIADDYHTQANGSWNQPPEVICASTFSIFGKQIDFVLNNPASWKGKYRHEPLPDF